MAQLTDTERALLTRLAKRPMLISRKTKLGRRFLLDGLMRRGMVSSALHQSGGGGIYSITQAGLKALADE